MSYGALFEGGMDIFEEDGGVKGRGRKRPRFGGNNNAWRYSSQSPSPEPASPVDSLMGEDSLEETQPKPQMRDEGAQTVEVETVTPGSEAVDRGAPASTPEQPSLAEREICDVHVDSVETSVVNRELSPSPRSPTVALETHNTLFGVSKPASATFSMFGTTTPVRAESSFNLADQVRFGFSHIPRSFDAAPQQDDRPVQGTDYHTHGGSDYPETYLSTPAPANYTDAPSYLDAVEGHADLDPKPVHGSSMSPAMPVEEDFGQGQWGFSAQSHHYNHAGGDTFEVDPEDTAVSIDGQAAHLSELSPTKIPEGFSSYGTHMELAAAEPTDEVGLEHTPQDSRLDDEILVSNGGALDAAPEDDLAVDSEIEGDSEGGDYDQRNYDIPDDDDEGVSDEDEFEREREEEPGKEILYEDEDEDGYGDSWGEEDEEQSDEDGDSTEFAPQQLRKPATATPVVISLLSDSEDEEEEPSHPSTVSAANPVGGQRNAAPSQPSIADLANAAQHHRSQEANTAAVKTPEIPREDFENVSPLVQDRVQVVDFAESGSSVPADPPGSHLNGPAEGSSASEDAEIVDNRRAGVDDDGRSPSESALHSDSEDGSPRGEQFSRQSDDIYSSDEDEDMEYDDGQNLGNVSASGGAISQPDAAEDGMEIVENEDIEVQKTVPSDTTAADAQDNGNKSVSINNGPLIAEEETEKPGESSGDEEMAEVDAPSAASELLEVIPETGREEEVGSMEDDVEMVETTPLITEAESHATPLASTSKVLSSSVTVSESVYNTPSAVQAVQPGSALVSADHDEPDRRSTQQDNSGEPSQQANGSALSHSSSPAVHSVEPQGPRSSRSPPFASPTASRPTSKEGAPNHQLPTPMESQLTAEMVSETHLIEEYQDSESGAPGYDEASRSIVHVKTDTIRMAMAPMGLEQLEEPSIEYSAVEVEMVTATNVEEEHRGVLDAELSLTKPLPTAIDVTTPDRELADEPADGPTDEPTVRPAFDPAVDPAVEQQEEGTGHDESHVEDDTTIMSASASVVTDSIEHNERDSQMSPHSVRRSTRKKMRPTPAHSSPSAAKEAVEDQITVQTHYTRSYDASMSQHSNPASPDTSIHLARQAVAAKRPKKAPEPLRTSPRVTRARSNSVQMSATSEIDEDEDASISLAKAALASPSKLPNADLDSSTASLKSELTKRLRSHRECISLKSIRNHPDEHPNILAVVTTQPPAAVRAKGGPREYMMTFNVTDPSMTLTQVTEVQLYRPHKESLPIVAPGDAILLQKFQVKGLSKKGFGLRSHGDSAWAVFDEDEGPPQIKGPPVEDWEQYSEYMGLLREWYRSLDSTSKGKIERANKKLEEASQGK